MTTLNFGAVIGGLMCSGRGNECVSSGERNRPDPLDS